MLLLVLLLVEGGVLLLLCGLLLLCEMIDQYCRCFLGPVEKGLRAKRKIEGLSRVPADVVVAVRVGVVFPPQREIPPCYCCRFLQGTGNAVVVLVLVLGLRVAPSTLPPSCCRILRWVEFPATLKKNGYATAGRGDTLKEKQKNSMTIYKKTKTMPTTNFNTSTI